MIDKHLVYLNNSIKSYRKDEIDVLGFYWSNKGIVEEISISYPQIQDNLRDLFCDISVMIGLREMYGSIDLKNMLQTIEKIERLISSLPNQKP